MYFLAGFKPFSCSPGVFKVVDINPWRQGLMELVKESINAHLLDYYLSYCACLVVDEGSMV